MQFYTYFNYLYTTPYVCTLYMSTLSARDAEKFNGEFGAVSFAVKRLTMSLISVTSAGHQALSC